MHHFPSCLLLVFIKPFLSSITVSIKRRLTPITNKTYPQMHMWVQYWVECCLQRMWKIIKIQFGMPINNVQSWCWSQMECVSWPEAHFSCTAMIQSKQKWLLPSFFISSLTGLQKKNTSSPRIEMPTFSKQLFNILVWLHFAINCSSMHTD